MAFLLDTTPSIVLFALDLFHSRIVEIHKPINRLHFKTPTFSILAPYCFDVNPILFACKLACWIGCSFAYVSNDMNLPGFLLLCGHVLSRTHISFVMIAG